MEIFSPQNPLYREIVKGVEFVNTYAGNPIKFAQEGIYVLDCSEVHPKGCWMPITEKDFWSLVEAIRCDEVVKYIELEDTYLIPVITPLGG